MSKFKRNSNVVVNIKRHDVNATSEKEVKHEPRESRILMIKTRDGKVLVDRTNKKKKDKSNNITKTDSKVVEDRTKVCTQVLNPTNGIQILWKHHQVHYYSSSNQTLYHLKL